MTGACGVPPEEQLRGTTTQTFRTSQQSGGLTKYCDDSNAARTPVSPISHTHRREGTKFENAEHQESVQSIRLTFDWFNIHTGWYVDSTQESKTWSAKAA
jgi:hypothetical protein